MKIISYTFDMKVPTKKAIVDKWMSININMQADVQLARYVFNLIH